jgi:NAD(P)-dependent dehydrogenase (short-subunit alcohol dehydrogenase family)
MRNIFSLENKAIVVSGGTGYLGKALGMAKAAVINFTSYPAANLAKYGIRVNAVAPGPIPDPAKNPPEDFLGEPAKKTMLGRIGKPEEIAGARSYIFYRMHLPLQLPG